MTHSAHPPFWSSKLYPGRNSAFVGDCTKFQQSISQPQESVAGYASLEIRTYPIAYARPQLGRNASGTEFGTHVWKVGDWRNQQTDPSIGTPNAQVAGRRTDHEGRAGHGRNLDKSAGRRHQKEGSSNQRTPYEEPDLRPVNLEPHAELVYRSRSAESRSDIVSDEVPPSSRGSPPVQRSGDIKHDPGRSMGSGGLTRRELEWRMWEQRERQEEDARRERKRTEIARRQQEARDRRAASEVRLL